MYNFSRQYLIWYVCNVFKIDFSTYFQIMDTPILKNVPLPISSLPTISFGFKADKPVDNHVPSRGFTLSNPIEYDLSVNNTVPATSIAVSSS